MPCCNASCLTFHASGVCHITKAEGSVLTTLAGVVTHTLINRKTSKEAMQRINPVS